MKFLQSKLAIAIVSLTVGTALGLPLALYQLRHEQRYRKTSVVFVIASPLKEITVILDNDLKKLANPQTGFVRFEEIAPGRHQVEYLAPDYQRATATIEVRGANEDLFNLPALQALRANPAPRFPAFGTLKAERGSQASLKPDVPRPWVSVEKEGCCWIFLGRFETGRDGYPRASPDDTVVTEMQLPTAGRNYVIKQSVAVRRRVKRSRLFLDGYEFEDHLGQLDTGTVIRLTEVMRPDFFNSAWWGKIEIHKPAPRDAPDR